MANPNPHEQEGRFSVHVPVLVIRRTTALAALKGVDVADMTADALRGYLDDAYVGEPSVGGPDTLVRTFGDDPLLDEQRRVRGATGNPVPPREHERRFSIFLPIPIIRRVLALAALKRVDAADMTADALRRYLDDPQVGERSAADDTSYCAHGAGTARTVPDHLGHTINAADARHDVAASLHQLRMPHRTELPRLITEWASRAHDAQLDELVTALAGTVVAYANALDEEKMLAAHESKLLDAAEAHIATLEARLRRARHALLGHEDD